MKRRWKVWWALALASLMVAGNARAISLQPGLNLVDLLNDSDSIIIGSVTSVTDGIDPTYGLPYTEITVLVEETLLGTQPPGEPYTFRQLGLLRPRPSDDGTKIMPEAQAGMPRYAAGDRVMLFLNPPASVTGLQTTVALGMGTFLFMVGNATNELGNASVFQNVSLADGLATANDERILATTAGSVNQADFLSLVRRAVEGDWIHTCQMWKTDEGMPSCGKPRQRPVTSPGSKTRIDPKRTPSTSADLGAR